jgi:hypothetical protein
LFGGSGAEEDWHEPKAPPKLAESCVYGNFIKGKFTLKLDDIRWELTSKLHLRCLILPVAIVIPV